MSGGPATDPVESLTVHLGQLEITISVRPRANGSASESGEPIASPSTGTSGNPAPNGASWERLDRPSFSSDFVERILRAQTARDFIAFTVPQIDHLLPRLRASDRDWSPKARLVRAFRAGLLARFRLDGEYRCEDSPGIPWRNTYYVVLRGRNNSAGFWTNNYNLYHSSVFETRSGSTNFERTTVSHAFPSLAELEAYILGAQVAWPPEVQQ